MLPVEEIRGVPRVEGVGCKARERCKDRARPLPPIAEKIQHAERARSGWMRTYGRRVPPVEVEISMMRAWRLFAPRVAAFRAVGRAVCRAMELRLGGELPAEPLRIRSSFRMTHVHRAIERQTDLPEHRAIQPKISVPFPERWVPDSLFFFPLPGFLRPQCAVIVAPSLDESQELAVGHVAGVVFLLFRPVSGLIVGEPAAHRVNPEGQELVERRLKRTQPERALGQQIPVEGFHMPEVENNPVPLGNRSVVYRLRPNNAEKLVRAHARFRKPRLEVVTGADGSGKDSHGVFPFRFDARPLRRMRPN